MSTSNTATQQDNAELRHHLHTLAPFIWVNTEEESRFIKWLSEEYGKKKRHIFKVWKRSKGLVDLAAYVESWKALTPATAQPVETANINTALMQVLGEATPQDRYYYIFTDADQLLDGRDPMVLRRFLDLADQIHQNREAFKSIILVSHTLNIPAKMERMVRVVNFDLPSSALISQRVRETLQSDQILKDAKVDVTAVTEACAGLTLHEVDQIVLENLTIKRMVTAQDVQAARKDIIKKNPLIELIEPKVKFDDIGGVDRLKTYLKQRKGSWTKEAKDYGIPPFRGVLLVGLPGNGKSLSCKALAAEYGLPFVKFDPTRLFAGQVGASETNMRRALQTLERMAPCVAWIDEIEKAFAGMHSSSFSDSGTTARVIGSFLNWMQESKEDVILTATANDVSNLPPELLRRFDEIFFVGLPSKKEREAIFAIHIAKANRNPADYDLAKLADAAEQRSGAEIEKAIGEALVTAYYDGKRKMTTDDIERAVIVKPPIYVTAAETLSKITAWVGKDPKTGDGVRARFAQGPEEEPGMEAV